MEQALIIISTSNWGLGIWNSSRLHHYLHATMGFPLAARRSGVCKTTLELIQGHGFILTALNFLEELHTLQRVVSYILGEFLA